MIYDVRKVINLSRDFRTLLLLINVVPEKIVNLLCIITIVHPMKLEELQRQCNNVVSPNGMEWFLCILLQDRL